MDLRNLDLNLLVVFETLMRERNVTRAGRKLGLSQSATSGALGRLRETFDDPLFVRSSGGIAPTPRAEALIIPIRSALDDLTQALEDRKFDPLDSQRTFRVTMQDHAALIMLPTLISVMQAAAPNCSLRVARLSQHDPYPDLVAGSELAVGRFKRVGGKLERTSLLHFDFACLVRPQHSLEGRGSLRWYAAARHILVSPAGQRSGVLDEQLSRVNEQRTVELVVPDWTIAARLVTSADYVLSGPRIVLDMLARAHGLTVCELPREIQQTSFLECAWLERLAKDDGLLWLLEILAKAAAQL